MNPLLSIIGIACFAVLFAEASGIMYHLKKVFNKKRIKPLDCPMCLAWWLGILYGIINQSAAIYGIGFAATCSIAAIIISKQIRI